MKKRMLISFSFLLMGFGLIGQTWNQYKKEAKKAYENQEYGEALFFLDNMQKIDSAKFDSYFLQAEAARYYNAFQLAEKNYQLVLENEKSDYLLPATFGLADVLKRQGRYTAAINTYRDYLALNPDSQAAEHQEAQRQIQACQWAVEAVKKNDKDLIINQLGSEINTDYSDFAPVVFEDELLFSSLRFTAEEHKNEEAKKYSKILSLKEGNSNFEFFDLGVKEKETHSAHIAFNQKGDKMYFNLCQFVEGNIIQCKIYARSKLGENAWTAPTPLPDFINQKNTTITQPNIGFDESIGKEVLYFVSDRTGGKGGKDIWYSIIAENGQPSSPINLSAVNTSKDELSPFFHEYTQTLYFSSDGRKSLGGLDIYKVAKKEEKWQTITHTGFPLNSSYHDVYFSLNQNGSQGYLSSNREGTLFLDKQISACCYDIFKAEFNSFIIDLEVLAFQQIDGLKSELTGTNIQLFEVFENAEQKIEQRVEPIGNKHFYRINSNKNYKIVAQKDGFVSTSLTFDTDDAIPDEIITKEVVLTKPQLQVFTFNGNLETPLNGATVTLQEIDKDGNVIAPIPLKSGQNNEFFFPLEFGKHYKIVAKKNGFDPTEKIFSTFSMDRKEAILVKNLVLQPEKEEEPLTIPLKVLKPFPLYFDNDYPNPRSRDTFTNATFPVTLAEYKARKDQFKQGYSKGLRGELKIQAEYEVEKFFEKEMDATYKEFLKFTDAVLKRLETFETTVIIRVQAYSSPLASADYNMRLSKRRIQSMINFYRTYKNGAMRKYVDSGKLKILELPHGETQAPDNISDNPNDRKNSVYSIEASKQRRVVIREVESQQINIDSKTPQNE